MTMARSEAFKRCAECGERKHPYLFPLNRKTGDRGPVCLACLSEREMQRMAEMRSKRKS